jgi:hypothetical protein
MKNALQFLAVFASFFFTLFGLVLMARGLEISKGPLVANPAEWSIYRLDLADTFSFYAGCIIAAASFAFLWVRHNNG